LTSPPPAEKATARQDQTGKASTGDGARDGSQGGDEAFKAGGDDDVTHSIFKKYATVRTEIEK
jgi:hypothetical protein